MENKKRSRAPNFTQTEVRLLLKLALEQKHILENKRTDSGTWKMKEQTWTNITKAFNANSGQTIRTVETLRHKYDGMKKNLKKKVIQNRAEAMKTGGENPDYVPIDGPEKELLAVLSLSKNGSLSLFDSDCQLTQTTMTGELHLKEESVKEETVSINTDELEIYNILVMGSEENSTQSHEKVDDIEKPLEIKEEADPISPVESPTYIESKTNELQSKRLSWKKYSKKVGRDSRRVQMYELIKLKKELLQKQLEYVTNEELRAQDKHTKEMEVLELDILLKQRELQK